MKNIQIQKQDETKENNSKQEEKHYKKNIFLKVIEYPTV